MKTWSLLLLVTVISVQTNAYSKQDTFKISSLAESLRRAEKEDLTITKKEKWLKKDLIRWKSQNSSRFKKEVENELENDEVYQGLVYEVRDGHSQIEKAKVVARLALLDAAKKEYPMLRMTSLNAYGASSFNQLSIHLKRDLKERLVYQPKQSATDLQFQVQDWGRAIVSKDLKTVKWELNANSLSDNNTLEPGAEDIMFDKDPEVIDIRLAQKNRARALKDIEDGK